MTLVPPPPLVSPQPFIQKHKKRFTISKDATNTLNHSKNCSEDVEKNNQYHHDRVLIIPHLHYGLERIGSKIVFMDKDNALTHSPTLVSFGGYSMFGGIVDSKLLYLDLESSAGEGHLNVEFEWKLLGEFSDLTNVSYSSLLYCKERQSLLLFISTDYINIHEFSLKTKTWKCSRFLQTSYQSFFLMDREEKYLINILIDNIITINFHEANSVFSNMDNGKVAMPESKLKVTADLKREIIERDSVLPILDEGKILILSTTEYGYNSNIVLKSPDLFAIGMDNSMQQYDPLFYEVAKHPTLIQFPKVDESQKSKILISLFNYSKKKMILFVKDMNKSGIEELRYNPIPIELKPHALFKPISFGYLTKKNERRALLLSTNHVLFIIKLDYSEVNKAFPFISHEKVRISFGDVQVSLLN